MKHEPEELLLGCCLIDHQVIESAAAIVSPSDFEDADKGKLFGLLVLLAEKGELPMGAKLLLDETRKAGVKTSLASLLDMGQDTSVRLSDAPKFAKLIHNAANLRRLQTLIAEASKACEQDYADCSDIMRDVDKGLSQIATPKTTPTVSIASMADSVAATVITSTDRGRMVGTGEIILDRGTGGMHPGELVLVGGRPGEGKSQLALNISEFNVRAHNRKVLFCSLEMTAAEFTQRLLAMGTQINPEQIRLGELTEAQKEAIVDESEYIEKNLEGLMVWAPPEANIKQICSAARLQEKQSGLDLLIVDYLQLIRPMDSKRENYRHELGMMTKALKAIAKELQIPVIALSQLKRDAANQNTEPRISHLSESGQLEQDADQIWLLHKPDKDTTKLLIGKNRHAKAGWGMTLELHSAPIREFSEFTEYA